MNEQKELTVKDVKATIFDLLRVEQQLNERKARAMKVLAELEAKEAKEAKAKETKGDAGSLLSE